MSDDFMKRIAKPQADPRLIPEHHLWTLAKDDRRAEARTRVVPIGEGKPELRGHRAALRRPLINHDGLLQALHDKLADWKRLLRSRPVHGQTVLRTLLDGPIVIGAPTPRGVTWEASVNIGGIFETLSLQVASPGAFAHHVGGRWPHAA